MRKTLTALLIAALATAAPSQNPTGEGLELQSHVLHPEKVSPTAARLQSLKLPQGFQLRPYAEGLGKPRMLAVTEDGTVYLTRRDPGDCWMLKDSDGDGKADVRKKVASKKDLHGIAIRGQKLYLTTIKEVFVADRKADGTLGDLRRIMSNLPDGGQHPNRTIGFGPDGKLYVSVGSTCNACPEPNKESATMLIANADGSARKVYATGLRNTIGFGWHPQSKELWGADHGIDWLGDDDQPEEINRLLPDARYGWPYIYADGREDPANKPPAPYTHADWQKMSRDPDLLLTAHSAPMQLTFYTGNSFPPEYRNDAFIAMHGSWNRKPPSGYEIVRLRFQDGKPVKAGPFVSGFLVEEDGVYKQFGRPTGLAVMPDGSLLLGDDTHGVLYRVVYTGP